MAEEMTVCSMMANLCRWCCWRFDPEAQGARTVPLQSQRGHSSLEDPLLQLQEEVRQQRERIGTLRLTTQTFTTSLRNMHERIDAIETQLSIPQSRLSL